MAKVIRDALVGVCIDPDGETLVGKAERFRCCPLRERYDRARYADVSAAVHVDSLDQLCNWIRNTLQPEPEE